MYVGKKWKRRSPNQFRCFNTEKRKGLQKFSQETRQKFSGVTNTKKESFSEHVATANTVTCKNVLSENRSSDHSKLGTLNLLEHLLQQHVLKVFEGHGLIFRRSHGSKRLNRLTPLGMTLALTVQQKVNVIADIFGSK